MKAKMAASASAHIQKMSFSESLLIVFIITSCLSVKVDEERKVFIRLVIKNGNKESTCFSNGPVHAFPRGTRIRNIVGCSPRAFLVPDVLLWDPLHCAQPVSFILIVNPIYSYSKTQIKYFKTRPAKRATRIGYVLTMRCRDVRFARFRNLAAHVRDPKESLLACNLKRLTVM